MKKAVFPGSFDPITLGHVDILNRALPLFDEIVIALGVNSEKKYMFSLEQRRSFVEKCFPNNKKITLDNYSGLTVDFCKKNQAEFILRGLRNPADFEFEKAIAINNRKIANIETVFLLTSPETSFISSSIVRDILKNGGDATSLLPEGLLK